MRATETNPVLPPLLRPVGGPADAPRQSKGQNMVMSHTTGLGNSNTKFDVDD